MYVVYIYAMTSDHGHTVDVVSLDELDLPWAVVKLLSALACIYDATNGYSICLYKSLAM